MTEVVWPTERTEAIINYPPSLLIYGLAKTGKSEVTTHLPNALHLDLRGETDHLRQGRIMGVTDFNHLNQILSSLATENPFDYLVIDDLSILDDWAYDFGTLLYQNHPTGKKFNRENQNPNGKLFTKGHPNYTNVVDGIGQNGWRWHREAMTRWLSFFKKVSKRLILIGHIKEKLVSKVGINGIGEAVSEDTLNITGKSKFNYFQSCSDIAVFYREGNKGFLDFTSAETSLVKGGHCSHLKGKVMISEELEDGTIQTHWDKVYLDLA